MVGEIAGVVDWRRFSVSVGQVDRFCRRNMQTSVCMNVIKEKFLMWFSAKLRESPVYYGLKSDSDFRNAPRPPVLFPVCFIFNYSLPAKNFHVRLFRRREMWFRDVGYPLDFVHNYNSFIDAPSPNKPFFIIYRTVSSNANNANLLCTLYS